jgi:hypothetical protein
VELDPMKALFWSEASKKNSLRLATVPMITETALNVTF